MDIRDKIESQRNFIRNAIVNNDLNYKENNKFDEIMIESINKFDENTISIFGKYYKNEIILEEMLYDAKTSNDLEIVEESILDSIVDLKNKVVETIKSIWKRFKEWISSIAKSIKDFFSKSKKDDSGNDDSGNDDDTVKISGYLPSPDKASPSNFAKKEESSGKYSKVNIRSVDKNAFKREYNEKANTMTYVGYLFKPMDSSSFHSTIANISDSGKISRILESNDMNPKAYLNMIESTLKINSAKDVNAISKYVNNLLKEKNGRDNEERKISDMGIDTIMAYGLEGNKIIDEINKITPKFDNVYNDMIGFVKNAEDPARIKYCKQICGEVTKVGTSFIRIYVKELKTAIRTCYNIIRRVLK